MLSSHNIVGRDHAGQTLMEELRLAQHSFLLIDNNEQAMSGLVEYSYESSALSRWPVKDFYQGKIKELFVAGLSEADQTIFARCDETPIVSEAHIVFIASPAWLKLESLAKLSEG